MRILFYTVINMNAFHGSVVTTEKLANKLIERGHDVILFAPSYKGIKRNFNFNTVYLKPEGDGRPIDKFLQDISAAIQLIMLRRKNWKPDIVVSRFGMSTILFPLVCNVLKIPYITELHGSFKQFLASWRIPRYLMPVFLSIEKLNYLLSHKVVTVSDDLTDLVRATPGIDKSKVLTLPNAVEVSNFSGISTDNDFKQAIRGKAKMVFGFVGLFEKWVGLENIVEAFSILNTERVCIAQEIRVILIGDGTERKAIERLIEKYNLGDIIRLTGWVEPADIPRYLSCFDVALAPYLPDISPKGCSLKILEYLAAGKWVIASEMPVVSRIIRETNSGIIIKDSRPESILEAIIFSWDHRDIISKNREESRHYIETNFSWDIRMKKIEAILQNSLKGIADH